MAIRMNPDGSITVGILPEEKKGEQETAPKPKEEKPKAKKPTKK